MDLGCDSDGDLAPGRKGALSFKHVVVQKILNVEDFVHVDRIKTILRGSILVRREGLAMLVNQHGELGIRVTMHRRRRKHGVVIAPLVKQTMTLHVVQFVLARNHFVLNFISIVFELVFDQF